MINPSGPDLLISVEEKQDFIKCFNPELRQQVIGFYAGIEGQEEGVMVERRYWLHLTEGYGYTPGKDRTAGVIPVSSLNTDLDDAMPEVELVQGFGTDKDDHATNQAALKELLGRKNKPPGVGERYADPNTQEGANKYAQAHEVRRLVAQYGFSLSQNQSFSRGWKCWDEYCRKTNKSPWYIKGQEKDFLETMISFCSYDATVFGNKSSTIAARISAICVMHKHNGLPDPNVHLEGVRMWLKALKRLEGDKAPRYPYPSILLWSLLESINGNSWNGACLKAALTVGFTFILRSCMYLKTAKYEGQLCWRHVEFLSEEKRLGTLGGNTIMGVEKISGSDGQLVLLYQVQKVRLKLISPKNGLREVSRTLAKTENILCPVTALVNLYNKIRETTGSIPDQNMPVFTTDNKKQLKSVDVNLVLQDRAVQAGLDVSKIGTHSLRKGGVTAYLAQGADRTTLQIFGFWYDESAFLQYEWLDANALEGPAIRIGQHMPMLELQTS